jgi:hypothetical protein
MYLLQEVTHVLVYGMVGCAGQIRHVTPRESVNVPHLYDLKQQNMAVNVSEYVYTFKTVTKFYAVEEDKGMVK